jgi:methanogenic corrinoid protein MtbC1
VAHTVPQAEPPARPVPDALGIATLCHLLATHDTAAAAAHVEALHQAGMTPEELYLELFAPAARALGRCWETDACDFATVTLGMIQLRRIQRDHAPRFLQDTRPVMGLDHTVLLVPVPGEQHTFGLDLVADFFRRAGWRTHTSPVRSADELASLVRRESYAIIGISIGSADRMDTLATTIRKLRRASRNRAIGVMVGGPAFIEHPEYAALAGADTTATDGRQAPLQAERLLSLLAQRG